MVNDGEQSLTSMHEVPYKQNVPTQSAQYFLHLYSLTDNLKGFVRHFLHETLTKLIAQIKNP